MRLAYALVLPAMLVDFFMLLIFHIYLVWVLFTGFQCLGQVTLTAVW